MIDLIWYQTINYPPLTPPSWVFPLAWTALYTMIFLSFVLFAVKRTEKSKLWGYVLFFGQLVLNLLWPPVFFGLHKIFWGLVIITILDILVFFNIKEFYKISKKSALFLIPYLLWLLFATYLTAGIFILN